MTPGVRIVLVITVVMAVLVAGVLLLPSGLGWVPVVAVIVFVGVRIAGSLRAMRAHRDASARIVAAHPDAVVLPTALLADDTTAAADRSRVVAVVVDSGGLSFRDADDEEVALVAAERVLSVELAPLDPRSAVRPIRVATIDGAPIEFWGGADETQQVDAVVAVRAALERR